MRWPLVSVLELRACPAAVRCARRYARCVLDGWEVPGGLVDDAEMLTSELASNAVQATASLGKGEPVAVRLLATGERLVIEAWDCHPGEPVPRLVPDDEAECGRGLAIVHELASRWGTRRLSGNVKAVWAELLLPAPAVSPGERAAR
jgi:anti-sigma regulatory factor (Ser/Thr protein kinase)